MADRALSLVGLLVILGLAYAFSKHRHAVNFRTTAWGVGLQLTFAVIILRHGTASFIGMSLLAFLVLLYIGQRQLGEQWSLLQLAPGALLAGGAGVAATYFLAATGLTGYLLALVGLVLLVTLKLDLGSLSRWTFAALMVLGLGHVWGLGIDGQQLFSALSDKVAAFLALSIEGSRFLFGNLADTSHFFPDSSTWPGFGFQFAFTVLPTIIFFSAFMAVMYYLGIVQVVIAAMARFMHWTLQTSGSETMSCSANVFVGQTEAPFLVKPFLERMTTSELHAIMVGGFATIAGSVLAGYIQMGVDAGHLLAASVMSAPAALVVAKLLYPETEVSETAGDVEMPKIDTADNVVEAAANGTTDGLKLALNVGAMLIAFIALIAFLDMVLGFGDRIIDGGWLSRQQIPGSTEYDGYFPGSMKTLFGTLLAPLAFVMGVPWVDSAAVGNLLGIKLTVNEFVSYGVLSEYIKEGSLQPRSVIIATYALCGFANFSSIGIQIGGLGALVPSLRSKLSKIGVRAMLGGAMASFMTATIAGFLLDS